MKKSEKQAEFIDGDDQLGAGNDPEKKSRKTHGRRKSPDENDGEAEARNGEDNDADQNDGKKRSKLKKGKKEKKEKEEDGPQEVKDVGKEPKGESSEKLQ